MVSDAAAVEEALTVLAVASPDAVPAIEVVELAFLVVDAEVTAAAIVDVVEALVVDEEDVVAEEELDNHSIELICMQSQRELDARCGSRR